MKSSQSKPPPPRGESIYKNSAHVMRTASNSDMRPDDSFRHRSQSPTAIDGDLSQSLYSQAKLSGSDEDNSKYSVKSREISSLSPRETQAKPHRAASDQSIDSSDMRLSSQSPCTRNESHRLVDPYERISAPPSRRPDQNRVYREEIESSDDEAGIPTRYARGDHESSLYKDSSTRASNDRLRYTANSAPDMSGPSSSIYRQSSSFESSSSSFSSKYKEPSYSNRSNEDMPSQEKSKVSSSLIDPKLLSDIDNFGCDDSPRWNDGSENSSKVPTPVASKESHVVLEGEQLLQTKRWLMRLCRKGDPPLLCRIERDRSGFGLIHQIYRCYMETNEAGDKLRFLMTAKKITGNLDALLLRSDGL